MSLPHTCGMTVRGAPDCPACRARSVEGAPPPSHFPRMPTKRASDLPRYAGLKPYTDEQGRDHDGLKRW